MRFKKTYLLKRGLLNLLLKTSIVNNNVSFKYRFSVISKLFLIRMQITTYKNDISINDISINVQIIVYVI